MGKHTQASIARMQRYKAKIHQGMEFETASLDGGYAHSAGNIRSMWGLDGAPRVLGKPQGLAWRNDRKNAHPPFVNRNRKAKALPMA